MSPQKLKVIFQNVSRIIFYMKSKNKRLGHLQSLEYYHYTSCALYILTTHITQLLDLSASSNIPFHYLFLPKLWCFSRRLRLSFTDLKVLLQINERKTILTQICIFTVGTSWCFKFNCVKPGCINFRTLNLIIFHLCAFKNV